MNTMQSPKVANYIPIHASWRRSFFVALFFVTLASLLFWLDSFRVYQSELRVLVIPKTSTVAIDQVVENFAELSRNLSFYERVLAGNDLIDDRFEGSTKDERKAGWNEIVSVKRSAQSGVLVVTATEKSPESAKRLSEETAKTLFAVASFYYNVKTDIDLRIVDEPIGKTTVGQPVPYVVTSVGSALILTTLFFVLLSALPSLFGRRDRNHTDFPVGASVPYIDPQKFVPARPAMSFESTTNHREAEPVAAAPSEKPAANERLLPGMDATELPFQFEESFPPETETELTDLPVMNGFVESVEESAPVALPIKQDEIKKEEVKKEEPTIEEYKRRLNELLSGGK